MKPRKKIAYVLKMFPRFAETFILNEILELERQGVALLLVSLKRPNEAFRQEQVKRVQCPVLYAPEPVRLGSLRRLRQWPVVVKVLWANLQLYRTHPGRYRRALRAWRRLKCRKEGRRFLIAGYLGKRFLESGIDHVHAHFANDPAAVARFICLLTDIPYSFTAHAKDIYLSDASDLSDKIHEARFVVTCTKYNRRYLRNVARNGTPIHTIYHGLDAATFLRDETGEGAARRAAIPNGPPLILSVGRLVAKKGFDVLIAACHLLRYWGVAMRCEIVGEGPLHGKLEQQIARLGLQTSVELLPFLPHRPLVAKYRQARLFALPCRIAEDGDRDGIPNVLVEAMATGLPVVATRVSGISEIVEPRENGILVPPENPWALAEALRDILLRPEAYRHLATNGRETVRRRFDLTENVAHLRDLLHLPEGEPQHDWD